MSKEEPTVPQWICTHCFIHLVNGDCTEPDTCPPDPWKPDEGPLHLFGDMHVTPGMLSEYHDDSCDGDESCGCEENTFSWSACDGCGRNLGGTRHAVTGWV